MKYLAFILALALLLVPVTHSQGPVVIHQYKAVSAAPPLPSFDNVVGCWALNNFNPVGYPEGEGVFTEDVGGNISAPFTAVAPYPIDWVNTFTGKTPPFPVSLWDDQNSNANDLVQVDAARPVLDAVAKEIDFDGATSYLSSVSSVGDGHTWTSYLRFKAGSLVETSVLFEVGINGASDPTGLSVRMVAGVLTVSMADGTPIVPLLNTKIKTISDSNFHLLSIVINTDAAAANQVLIWVDGSQSGVTAPISTNLAGENITQDTLFVGTHNQATQFFTGSMTDLLIFNVAQDATLRGQWQIYINALYP